MTYFINKIAQQIYSVLPKNEHAIILPQIESAEKQLQLALQNKTGETFTKAKQATREFLSTEKTRCEEKLLKLNGKYSQDPDSQLKKAWDDLDAKVFKALGSHVKNRSDLDPILEQLSNHADANTESFIHAKTAIQTFISLEKERDSALATIQNIISTEKTEPASETLQRTLNQQRSELQQRRNELCGLHYRDTYSLLDKAWKNYESAAEKNSPNKDSLLQAYNALETERKQIDASIHSIDQQLSINSLDNRSLENVTTLLIQDQLSAIQQAKQRKTSQSGVDWLKTGATATTVALAAIGIYVFRSLYTNQ